MNRYQGNLLRSIVILSGATYKGQKSPFDNSFVIPYFDLVGAFKNYNIKTLCNYEIINYCLITGSILKSYIIFVIIKVTSNILMTNFETESYFFKAKVELLNLIILLINKQ